MYNIYPKLKKQAPNEMIFKCEEPKVFFIQKMDNVKEELESFLDFTLTEKLDANILFLKDRKLGEEAYTIDVCSDKLTVKASANSGFYYAVKTLKQMLNGAKAPFELEGTYIEDEPDLRVRGLMYDISRNKVAKLETLMYIADIMSELKMNHLELYVEGFSFEYKSFPEYLQKNAYVKVSEYKKLERYCKDRAIDLVPNQNGFGHMTEWLDKEEFKDLAELPEGMDLWGSHRSPSTLDPNDPRSVELVTKMYEDMLPYSKSDYFNMNFDEPFELGLGKSKELAEKKSVEEVYIDFVNKIVPHIYKYNKHPLIWGDVLVRHNASLENMPKDIIYLDWGYEGNYPFYDHLKKLKDANVKFISAPGTTTWCGWLGRLYDWVENIDSAITSTYRLDGEGVLVTDWGDFGHVQPLAATLPPLVFTGLQSYRCKNGTIKEVRQYLNKFIFKDKNNLFADVLMDASSYYQYEKNWRGNGTVAYATWSYAVICQQAADPIARFEELMRWSTMDELNVKVLVDFLELKKKQVKMCDVDQLWKDELTHTLNLIESLTYINGGVNKTIDLASRIKYLEKGIKDFTKSMKTIKKVWMPRNKVSYLDRTLDNYSKAIYFLNNYLDSLKGGTNEA